MNSNKRKREKIRIIETLRDKLDHKNSLENSQNTYKFKVN